MYKGLNWEKSKEFWQKYFVFVIYAEKGYKNCVIFSVTFSNKSKNLLWKNVRGTFILNCYNFFATWDN